MSLRSRAKNVLRDVCFERKRAALWRRRAHSTKEDSFEINLKLRKQNPTIHKHHEKATRFEKLRNEIFCLRGTESKAQKHPHITSAACCCVSHQLLFSFSLSLSLHISLTQTRGEHDERRLSGERRTKAKRAARSVAEYGKRNIKLIFPSGIRI